MESIILGAAVGVTMLYPEQNRLRYSLGKVA